MKVRTLAILMCSVTALSFVACKSTPAAEEAPQETTEETPVVEQKEDFSGANQTLMGKLDAARTAAIEAEAKKYFPELFDQAEKDYNELKKNTAENPNTDYSSQVKDLTAKYQSLEKAAKAQAMKEQIDQLQFASLDQAGYDKAGAALAKYAELGASGSSSDLLDQANIAYNSYSSILTKGYTSLVKAEKEAALAAKKNAESVKAQMAKKTEYQTATAKFQKADVAKNFNNLVDKKAAYEGFKSAKEIYTEIYETVKKNREEAQAKIDAAKKRVEQAENYSEEADKVAPLTEKVAGIEDENAVLLEKDTFANPEDSIIDVNTSTDVSAQGDAK